MTTKKAEKSKQAPAAEKAPAAPTQQLKPGLKIIGMLVENIKRVKFAQIKPRGNVVIVSGDNGSGKSSVLDSISWALTGTSTIPSMPIRKGQHHGRIAIDIGDFKIVREFTRVDGGKDPYLTKLLVFGRNKERFPTPQALLDGLMGAISFDPLEFIRMEGKKQLDTLRKLVTLDVDLDAIEAEKKAAYDARRDAGRDVESAKNRLAGLQVPPEGLPEQPIDTAALAAKLSTAAEHNGKIQLQKAEQETYREAAHAVTLRMAQTNRDIDALRERILELEKSLTADHDKVKHLSEKAEAMTFADPIDTAEVAAELNQAQTTNGAIQRREAYLSVKAEVTAAEARWTAHDEKVKAKDKERLDAITRAKMPIEGISIGESEVLFDDIPFAQASNAEQIRVSVALAIACNPTLRVLRIKDGSLLDKESMALLQTMATKADYQLWIERVEAAGEVSVVMEDGEATGEETEPKAPAPTR
jgi:energy-coupling factor transporter ATP-binding protein EcfA2